MPTTFLNTAFVLMIIFHNLHLIPKKLADIPIYFLVLSPLAYLIFKHGHLCVSPPFSKTFISYGI